ncbi:ferric-chelate reductase Frp1 [Vermiconidia calcicola]|uniref:Ferric-chelate reductase Frp1 n=1 Tax=Vermiconidia calcicola TaxID=1690605 RepID=A0ACC3MJU5_9PEZI|nr:ferric-chelate reductase Frp1 [Vermiconidia calcicola]
MDMSGMDMSMGSESPFRPVNEKLSHALWYGIAGVVGLLTVIRVIRILETRRRHQLQRQDPSCTPSRPAGRFSQAFATVTTSWRELSYPQPVYFTGRISKYFSPLPVGRWLILIFYWTVLLCFLWVNTLLAPNDPMYAYKWEIVGFRAAWVSVSQIPFIYLLSCKFNPVSMLTGISYERFNWLHRWAARTVFLTVIVHWSYFYRGWDIADFVKLEIQMMPMVKYGFGAWAVLGWMILSGFGFFRNLSYELFVAQHICAAATLLWLLYVHVPTYTRYHIYMAIGFVAFDWSVRIIWMVLRNTHVLDRIRARAPGYATHLETLPGDRVRITIDDPAFRWKPGQHVYLSLPRLGPFEMHPFTIANTCEESRDGRIVPLTMIVRAHSGFSRRLFKAAMSSKNENQTYQAFLSGPWGMPPDLSHYESVVLIACSSGASFIVPLLQELKERPSCARKVTLHWIIGSVDHLSWYERDLIRLAEATQRGDLRLQVVVHITQSNQRIGFIERVGGSGSAERKSLAAADSCFEGSSSSESVPSLDNEKGSISAKQAQVKQSDCSMLSMRYGARPTIDSMVRPAVEAALGETAVVVCGGLSVTAQTRTYVAALSDERGVHKGSGAQGIFLFSETYGW